MTSSFEHFQSVAQALKPRWAVILGSGLGSIVERVSVEADVKFADVPGFATPTVHGHGGRVVVGRWAGQSAIVFQGRMHFYEGHTWDRATATVRLAADLGVRHLLLTNAAGGIRDDLQPGDLMAIIRHLKWLDPDGWKRDPVSPYSQRLLDLLPLVPGTYAALTGPAYETPAEIRALRAVGADAVGMSTAVEAETAATLGLEVAAISCITNKAAGLSGETLSHAGVQQIAGRADVATRLANLLERLIVEGTAGNP